jgi:hypothetical protein
MANALFVRDQAAPHAAESAGSRNPALIAHRRIFKHCAAAEQAHFSYEEGMTEVLCRAAPPQPLSEALANEEGGQEGGGAVWRAFSALLPTDDGGGASASGAAPGAAGEKSGSAAHAVPGGLSAAEGSPGSPPSVAGSPQGSPLASPRRTTGFALPAAPPSPTALHKAVAESEGRALQLMSDLAAAAEKLDRARRAGGRGMPVAGWRAAALSDPRGGLTRSFLSLSLFLAMRSQGGRRRRGRARGRGGGAGQGHAAAAGAAHGGPHRAGGAPGAGGHRRRRLLAERPPGDAAAAAGAARRGGGRQGARRGALRQRASSFRTVPAAELSKAGETCGKPSARANRS